MMTKLEIRQLILDRQKECGIGLCGRFDAIARWLFNNYNVITTGSYVRQVIRGE